MQMERWKMEDGGGDRWRGACADHLKPAISVLREPVRGVVGNFERGSAREPRGDRAGGRDCALSMSTPRCELWRAHRASLAGVGAGPRAPRWACAGVSPSSGQGESARRERETVCAQPGSARAGPEKKPAELGRRGMRTLPAAGNALTQRGGAMSLLGARTAGDVACATCRGGRISTFYTAAAECVAGTVGVLRWGLGRVQDI